MAAELTEAGLRKTAGGTSHARGEDYVRYVHGLRIDGTRASASIQARRVYLVELDWSSSRIAGSCTCPHHLQGNFCKHLVALGLAVVDEQRTRTEVAVDSEPDVVAAYVESLDAAALRTLVRELADGHPDIQRTLQVRAATVSAEPGVATAELTRLAQEALRTRGFVDYRRSFDVARDAEGLLDELESHVGAGAGAGAADAVRPALLKAVTRLRAITLNADDSSGSIGTACQRALDLYARTCREGSPDATKLAKWLVKFRDDSPGWPVAELADFVDAFDERAMTAYRAAVARLDAARPNLEDPDRFEVDRMLLELADHDQDVNKAVELLTRRPGHEDYPGVVDRLRSAGRLDEAFWWTERAVAAGRVSARMQTGRRSFWMDPDEIVEEYVARGRGEEALEILRGQFAAQPEVPRFRALLDLARRVGSVEEERARAFAVLDEKARQPFGSGAARIRIAIAERDLEGAWAAAQEHGAADAWRELAGALAADFPSRAAELYQPRVDEALTIAESSKYREIGGLLDRMRELCDRSGEAEDFAAYVDGIRTRYRRRTSLMAELDRRGL